MKLKIYNFVFETYEDPSDYYIDCNMNVINKDDHSVNQQCEVQLDQGWISIESKMPDDGVWVIGYVDGDMAETVCWNERNEMFENGFEWVENVTHWMPLPNPPKF